MAYDYYGAWSKTTGYNSPLYDDSPGSTLSQVWNMHELHVSFNQNVIIVIIVIGIVPPIVYSIQVHAIFLLVFS